MECFYFKSLIRLFVSQPLILHHVIFIFISITKEDGALIEFDTSKHEAATCDDPSNVVVKSESRVTKKNGLLTCKKCSYKTYNRHTLNSHQTKHRNKTVSCTECSKMFVYKSELKKHMRTHGIDTFECKQCGKYLSSKGSLGYHNVHAHGEKGKYICTFDNCDRSFARKDHYIDHVNNCHLKVKNYQCKFCMKKLTTKSTLQKHSMICNPPESAHKYVCVQCNKVFPLKQYLNQHKQMHTPVRFHCANCDKHYQYKVNLTKHLKVCGK